MPRIIKSKLGDLPPIPEANVHNLYFGVPPGTSDIPDYDLYIDGLTGHKVTSHEFRETVRDAATALIAPQADGGLGVSGDAKDIVGIYSHNCIDFLALCHAALVVTTPFALLSAYATPYELAHGLRTTKPRYLFVQPALLPNALAAAKEVGLPQANIFLLHGQANDSRASLQDIVKRVKARGVQRTPVRPAKHDTLAYLVFSSGTSGLPKAVAVSHKNLWAMCFAQIKMRQAEDAFTGRAPQKQAIVALAFLPFYHAYSLHIATLRPFAAPMTVVIVDKWNATNVLRLTEKYRVNMLSLVPSAVHQLVNHPAWESTDLSSVVGVLCGASYLPPTLRQRFLGRFKNPIEIGEGYGMSEQTLGCVRKPVAGFLGLHPPPGACGILNPGVEARIVREDGSDADVGEPGELWTRGATIVLGYYGNEQATRETFVDGWLRTGDVLKVDKDGFFYFVERKKDTLKIGGSQVSPNEIEDVIRAHPSKLVTDVCVGGVSGGRLSDEKNPRAWIVLSDEGRRLGEAETFRLLDEWTKKNLSSYKWVRAGFEVVAEIPKNPTGKVMRRLLQDKYEAQLASKAKL